MQHFGVMGHRCARQDAQVLEQLCAACQCSHRYLTHNERMTQDISVSNRFRIKWIRRMQMIDPHGGVDQYH